MVRIAMVIVILGSALLGGCATAPQNDANSPPDWLKLYGRLDSEEGRFFVVEICALGASYGTSQYRQCAESELTRGNSRFFNLTTLEIPAQHNHIECPAATWVSPSKEIEREMKYCSEFGAIYETETIKSALRTPIQTIVTLGTNISTWKELDKAAFADAVRQALPDDQRLGLLQKEEEYRHAAPERQKQLRQKQSAQNAERDRMAQRARELNLQDPKSVGDTVCAHDNFGNSSRGQVDAVTGGRYRVLVSGVKGKRDTSYASVDQRVEWFDPGQVYRCF